MSKFLYKFKYFKYILVLTLLLVIALIHITMLIGEYKYTIRHVEDYTEKISLEFEDSITNLNVFHIRSLLLQIKDSRIISIKLISPVLSEANYSSISVGELNYKSLWIFNRYQKIIIDGIVIATIDFNISLLTLSKIVVKKNWGVYVLLVIILSGLVILTNFTSFVIIKRIENFILEIISISENKKDHNSFIGKLIDSEKKISKSSFLSVDSEAFEKLINTVQQLVELEREKTFIDAKAKVARQVAHDIRSPLTCLGTVARMAKGLNQNDARLLIKSVKRINEVAEELLDAERLSQNSFCLDHQIIKNENIHASKSKLDSVNLSQLLRETHHYKSLEYSCFKNLKLDTFIDSSASNVFVFLEESKFKRVFSNLINNAVESIPPMRQGFVSTSLSKDENVLILEIRDNGIGIDADNLSKILQNGFSTGKQKGNGLGLSYAREVVESINGKLRIFSQVNIGTTVRITLNT